jgi:hypothetical protein
MPSRAAAIRDLMGLGLEAARLVPLWNGVGDKSSSSSPLALYAKWGGVSGCARALAHA